MNDLFDIFVLLVTAMWHRLVPPGGDISVKKRPVISEAMLLAQNLAEERMHLSGKEKSVHECAKKAHHRWAFYCAIYFAVFWEIRQGSLRLLHPRTDGCRVHDSNPS